MKKITKFLLLVMIMSLSTTVIFAQVSSSSGATPQEQEKYEAQNALEQQMHGPTTVVPKAQPGSRAVGDDCTTPIVVTVGALPYSYSDPMQTTCGRGNNYEDTDLGPYDGGEDIIYELVVTEFSLVTITMTTTDNWTGLGLFSGCPGYNSVQIATGYTGDKSIAIALDAGTYYIMADTYPSPNCISSFDLTITAAAPLPGQACTTAFSFGNVNDSPVNSETSYGGDYDWYSFTGSQNMIVTASLCGSDFDTKLEVWNDCGDASSAYDNDDACGLQSEIEDIAFTAGETMYVKVFGYGSNYGDYTLNITGIPDPGDIEGYVYDNIGDPIAGATVEVAAQSTSTTTDVDGYYLLTGIGNGSQDVTATKAAYDVVTHTVDVIAYDVVEQDFTLPDAPAALIVLPENAHLGYWPIDAWQQGTVITATNMGAGSATVDAISIIGGDADLFSFEAPDLPIILAVGDTFNITLSFNAPLGTPAVYYDAIITLSYGARAATACDIDVTAYDAPLDDVFENAYEWHWDPAPTSSEPIVVDMSAGNSREYAGFYKNYILPNDLVSTDNDMDLVYKLELESDMMWSIHIWGDQTNIAIYAEDFGGEGGPMAHNALYQFTEPTFNMPLFAGNYYMVFSCSDGWPDWGSYTPTYMTAPAKVTYTDPDDHETGIIDEDFLAWDYNDLFAEQYTVYLGTSQPFTDADIVAIAAPTNLVSDTFQLADLVGGLLPNQVYFWQVDVMNNVGTTAGETWDFTSTISPPLDFAAASTKIFEGDVVNLTWTNPLTDARTLLGYNVYRDLTQLNIDPIEVESFTDTALLELVYNMTGYTYNVTSVFNEGESAYSADVLVKVSGNGTLAGTVTDAVTTLPILDADVTIAGKDEFGNTVGYSTTTLASGDYTQILKAGEYKVTVSKAGYVDGVETLVPVLWFSTTDLDFALIETPYPVLEVTAVEFNADSVEITWVPNPSRELIGYTVYRKANLQETSPFDLDVEIGTTTGAIMHDGAWETVDPGVYSWYVISNYTAGNNSEKVYSNVLYNDMNTVVSGVVTTEFDDSPLGAMVTFTSTTEPDLGFVYEEELGADGMFEFDPFHKGTYNILVELYGYDNFVITGEDIWDEQEYAWELVGATPPPENLTVLNDSLYMGVDDVKLAWDPPASSEFAGYKVYRDGVALFENPISELFYTAVDPAYDMSTNGALYTVTAVYLSGGESDPSEAVSVWITGAGSVDGEVYDGRGDTLMPGAQVRLDGFDEFDYPQSYVLTTDEDGLYSDTTVWAGVYDYSVTFPGFNESELEGVAVDYDDLTTRDFYLFPGMSVTATPNVEGTTVLLEWEFELDADRALIDFTIYRALWNNDMPSAWTEIGSTASYNFIDTDWETVPSGVYKWIVQTNYDDGTTYDESNYVDKMMEVVVDIEVLLSTAESPEGAEVTLTNISEPYREIEYEFTMDATGMVTIDPFHKGTYEVEVSLFSFTTEFDLIVVDTDSSFTYVLIENIQPVTNLYVNPNGYATWDVTQPGGLDFFAADFEGGLPSTMTYVNNGSSDRGDWVSTIYGYIGDGAYSYYSSYGGYTDTRMNTPKVSLTDNTIVQFAWALYYYDDTQLDIEISLNEGLTWTSIWSSEDATDPEGYWWEVTLDLAELGYTEGDAMFSIHKTDDYGWMAYFDELYIGDPVEETTPGIVAISTQFNMLEKTDKSNITQADINAAMANVEMLPNNLLASTVEHTSNRSLLNFKVSLDGIFSGDTEDTFYDYEVEESLVEGQEYVAKVEVIYTTGISTPMYYPFTYHACDYYNSVIDYTAERVPGTMDIALAWTSNDTIVDADEFIGTNVYRDGVLLTEEPLADTTETYTDENMVSGTYIYCVTQVYFSDAQSCEVCAEVIMTAGGYVNGFVTDSITGDPITGAFVTMVGTSTFDFETDTLGYYEGEVVEGTYDYSVSAASYETALLEGVVVDFGATVVKNFALLEFPYPVGSVIAYEVNDNEVVVTWGEGGGGGTSEWLLYDIDVMGFGGIGAEAADYSLIWGSKFVPSQLTDYSTGYVTKVSVNQLASVGDYVTEVRILSGDGSTVLYSQDVTGTLIGDQWNIIELDEAVPFDNTDNLWIAMYAERPGDTHNEPTSSVISVIQDRYDFFAYNGATWTSISGEYGIDNQAWMLRGFVSTTPTGKSVALGQGDYPNPNVKDYSSVTRTPSGLGMIKSEVANAKFPQYANRDFRNLEGFSVYRGTCEGFDMEFLGFTVDSTFTDNTWGDAETVAGIYSWAVEAVYTDNVSEATYSNCLDKDMATEVSVEVSTASGDSPEGTDVLFVNVSELTDPPIIFEAELDDTGMYTWTDFRKGTYDIFVHLNGYTDILVEDVDIWDAETFPFILQEMLNPVADLYVSPTANATWRPGGMIPFEPVMQDFNEGLPDTWTIVAGGSTSDTWFWTTDDAGNTLDGTPFMFVDSDAAGSGSTMDELLISPIVENTENADMLFVEFDYIYQYIGTGGEFFAVDVFDGNDWVNIFFSEEDSGPYPWGPTVHEMIDVTEYANAEFQVRFQYVSGGWNWYVAVDNVAVTDGSDRYTSREIEYYKVWIDGVFVDNTPNTFYQYDVSMLVAGQEYYSEVAAMYTSGMSAKMNYTWVYVSCDEFAGPEAIMGEVVGTNDVLVTWGLLPPPPPPIMIIDEKFDDYTAGGRLAEQAQAMGRDYWTTWSGAVGGAEDAIVSDAQSVSPSNSMLIEQDIDAVLLLDVYTEGVFNIDFDVYIPTDKLGYFNILQAFAGSGSEWGTQTYFNADGAGLTDAGAAGAGVFTYTYDTWHHVYTMIDLDADYAEMYFNGDFIVSWVWSSGSFGTGTRNELNAMDFYGAAAADGTLYDNLSVTMEAEDASTRDEIAGSNLYRDGILYQEMLQDTFYLDMGLDYGTYEYCVTYVYESLAESCLGTCVVVDVDEDCTPPENLTAVLDDETYDAVYLNWGSSQELVFITQNPGAEVNGLYQAYGNGYGVVYDLSSYPDALANSIEFHHASWGVFGPFEYNIHIIDWDTYTTIATLGPFTTTGDDIWEMDVALGDIDLLGASNVAFLMEPLSSDPADAYPDLSSDDAADPQGSVYGPLSDLSAIGSSTIGNWLMNIYIMTAEGAKVMAPVAIDLPVAESAVPRIGSGNVVVDATISQTATYADRNREFMGYNIYRDGSVIEELWQENMYTDTDLQAGNLYCYEVTAMYSYCGESAPSNEACTQMYVGLGELNENDISLYPNPASNRVNVTSTHKMTRVTVTNYVGQVVYVEDVNDATRVELNTNSYQAGVYLVKIETESGVVTKRVIIRR